MRYLDTWTLAAADPELVRLGEYLKALEEPVPEELPADKAPEKPALEEPALLIPPEEDALPDETIPDRVPVCKCCYD